MINQRLNEIRQELEALSRQATKKGEQFESADGKGKPIDLRQVWSFVKTGMMGLDFMPIIGNVNQIMKMAIGRDLNTEENLVQWKRDSAKLTDFADEEFTGVCVRDRDKIEEDTRNGFEKSIDSFQEIGSDFVTAAEDRSNKAFDSFGDFLNYVTSGISSGIYEGAKERDERKMDSFYNFGDWLTSGLIGTINGAFNPKEGAFSKGHWLNSLGLAMMIAAPIRAKIPTTPNLRKNIVAPTQKTTQSGIEKHEKVEINSSNMEEVKPRKGEDLVERSKVEGMGKDVGSAYDHVYTSTKPLDDVFPELKGVNPHYVEGAGPGINTNCISCANSSHARITGRDPFAVAEPSNGYGNRNALLPSAPYGFHGKELLVSDVKKIMIEAGDGSASVVLLEQGNIQHVINVINKNGEIFFVDTQIGKVVELNPNIILDVGRP